MKPHPHFFQASLNSGFRLEKRGEAKAIEHRGAKFRHKRLMYIDEIPTCTPRVPGLCLPRIEGLKKTQHVSALNTFSGSRLLGEITLSSPITGCGFFTPIPWRHSTSSVGMASSFH